MRILMLNHNVRGRSTYFRALGFGRALAKRGHHVTLVTISPNRLLRPRKEVVAGVYVVESPDLAPGRARSGWDPWDALYRSAALLAGNPYDLVHGFDCRPVVLVPSLLLRTLRSWPYVSDWADWWGRGGAIEERPGKVLWVLLGGVETYLEEQFRRYADAVTVTSRALGDRARGLGVRREAVHYIPSGADVEMIRPMAKARCRNELNLPEQVPIACFSGFVHYDLELAVRAFAVVRKQLPDARLLLVGPRSPTVRRLQGELGLGDGIIEVGVQPPGRIALYLGSADVLLLPFGNRPCNVGRGPIKLGDYVAAGRPIVTNPVGEMVPLFREYRIGILADETPEGFGRGTVRLLEAPSLAEAMGREARRVAEEHLAWAVVTEDLEACYLQVLERSGHGTRRQTTGNGVTPE